MWRLRKKTDCEEGTTASNSDDVNDGKSNSSHDDMFERGENEIDGFEEMKKIIGLDMWFQK